MKEVLKEEVKHLPITKMKCLNCKKGNYCISNREDRKGLRIYICNKCYDFAI